VAALSTAQLRAIDSADVAAIDSADLNALNSAQWQSFTTSQLNALSTDQIANLTTSDLSSLTTAQLAGFADSADIAALTTLQIQALTTQQISALATEQVSWLETQDIQALTTVQIQALTTAAIVALTTDQVQALETADLANLTAAQHLAFESADIAVMSTDQVNALLYATPIVLDLDGNGVTTTASTEGVQFDVAGTGVASKTGWVGGTDGLLVMDRNGDGVINDGKELFGAATVLASGQRAGNGAVALAEQDTNHDGKITAADANFDKLKVWVDANHDGKTDAGELKGLVDLNIVELDLSFGSSDRVDNGNLVGLVSQYKTSDGQTHEMADVWFKKEDPNDQNLPPLGELLAGKSQDLPVSVNSVETQKSVSVSAPPPAEASVAPALKRMLDDDLQQVGPLF
jgi:hypothetical protein